MDRGGWQEDTLYPLQSPGWGPTAFDGQLLPPSVVTGEPADILLHNSGARHPEKERWGNGGGGALALFIKHWIIGSQTQTHTHIDIHTLEGVGPGGGYKKGIQCIKFYIFLGWTRELLRCKSVEPSSRSRINLAAEGSQAHTGRAPRQMAIWKVKEN